MSNLPSFVFFGLAIALAVWLALVWRGFSQDWLPDELKDAKVAQVEKNLRADFPSHFITGRPDQVYRLPSGLHVPLENKNRDGHQVFETDTAQLSLQAYLLRLNGLQTAPFGYVAINSRRDGLRRAMRVDLRDDAYCERLIARYFDLIDGRAAPRKSRGRKCSTCGHRQPCHEK